MRADSICITWDDEEIEKTSENEEEDTKAVAEMNNTIEAIKSTHAARTHGIVKGKLTAHDDFSKHLRQSIFGYGAEYTVVCRYSSEFGDPDLDDRIPQPRGLAMNAFNIESAHLLSTSQTQKTPHDFIDLRLESGSNQPERYKHLEACPDTNPQEFRDTVRTTLLKSTRHFRETLYRFGNYATQYCLAASSETQKKFYKETVKPAKHEPDILSKWPQNFHRDHDAEHLLHFQLCKNSEDQPVECAGKV
ncbi:MAG: hypothetical protein Q9225_007503 [Loekoesia sp. 1 TL-2023]